MKTLRYIILLFLPNCWLFVFSQKRHVHFEHIGTDMGLSQNSVVSIFQDSRGFMWFGTRDGLNKYDGYKFTVYRYDQDNGNSIGNNIIKSIAEDGEGNIWLATWGGGLNRFDWKKEKFTSYQYNAKDPWSIGKDHINKLLRDSEDNLWIATEGGGLNRYDKKNNRFIHYLHNKNDPNSLSDDRVRDIAEDAGHNLWIGTNTGGLNLFDKKTKTFRHFQHDDKNSRSLSSNNNWALFIDSKNQLWIGTHGAGLNLLNRQTGEFIHFKTKPGNNNSLSSNFIRVINEDEEGDIWIGTENDGLSILNPRTATFDNYLQDDADNAGLNNNSIWSIYRDSKGDMWMGTFGGGINFVNRDTDKFTHYHHSSSPLSLSNNNVTSIFEDSRQNLWLGTDGSGLNLFESKKGTFVSYKHEPQNPNSLSGNSVLSIFEDSENNLWIGTWGNGITVFNKARNVFRHFNYDSSKPNGLSSPNAWTIGEDADKNIWIGTYDGGLSQYDRKNDSFINYRSDARNPSSLSKDYVNIIYADKSGNLWIGTNGSGLDLFDKQTKSFRHFYHDDNKNSVSNNYIYSLTEDDQGNLWIGTAMGLNRMDTKTRIFTSYYTKDGLPSDVIAGLLFDKKYNLWISTYNGLSRFNPTAKTFKNFDTNDGLQSNEFKKNACFKTRSGKMYFGGVNGFNCFYPDSIQEKSYEPPLVFTDFLIFNRQVGIGEKSDGKFLLEQTITATKELVLSYHQSVISFEFASLNYVFHDKKRYSYILEGFDREWSDIDTKHIATYTNLDPGRYVFKVRATNNQGEWSSAIASIALTITPPFWMTWWFKLALLAGILGIAVGFYRFRVSIIESQKKQLDYKVNEQTRQLIESAQEEKKARREAEEANWSLEAKNKELEQFAYVASHDLQEPLRTTISFVKIFKQQYYGKIDPKADKYLDYIVQASDRMRVLITDLLDFSRIGHNKEVEQVDCNLVLQDVIADLDKTIKESAAEIKAEYLPIISGYANELKQLFQNLIINSIKFRKKEVSLKIHISAKEKIDHWQFAFTDNGIGIDKEHNKRIFVIFQRLHTRTEYQGSGIGLAHCKKIVELHHGKIWVESVPNEGSTFYFTIHSPKEKLNGPKIKLHNAY